MTEQSGLPESAAQSDNDRRQLYRGRRDTRSDSERKFTEDVIDLAHHHQWTSFHLRDRESIHIVRGRGFPDLVLYRNLQDGEQIQLVAAELKRSQFHPPTADQRRWIEALNSRIPTFTWYPEKWDEIERVLRDGPPEERSVCVSAEPKHDRLVSGQIPADFVGAITGLVETIEAKEFDRGDHARLRRMDPQRSHVAAFWRLVSREGMPRDPDISKWGLIIQGMALMSHGSGLAHSPQTGVGRALYRGSGRRLPFYSEDRLGTLLAAKGGTLHRILGRLFRMLGNEGCSFNWHDMAWFILNEGYREEHAETARFKIAREYYQAASRSQNSPDPD